MPSFDIVSEVDKHELANAIDQANREVSNRFDFKGTNSQFTLKENEILVETDSDFQLKQMAEILVLKLSKRGIEVGHLDYEDPVIQLKSAKQTVKIKQGVDQESAKKIIKLIKDQKLKVQAIIQGDQVRVTGKKRDDLQEVIAFFRQQEDGIPLQFTNFRE
jgi:uncharacterized protein YajQ (UPF0234 family)